MRTTHALFQSDCSACVDVEPTGVCTSGRLGFLLLSAAALAKAAKHADCFSLSFPVFFASALVKIPLDSNLNDLLLGYREEAVLLALG